MDVASESLPFWGPPTSKANFCEEDYAVTRFIAEFINTLTNLAYIIYAVHGLQKIRGQPGAWLRSLPYWSLVGVGLCSGAFHLSLKYHTQMSDDLSMFVATGAVLCRLVTFSAGPTYAAVTSIGVMAILTIISIFHVMTDEIFLHASTFGVMVVYIGIKTPQLISHRIHDTSLKRKIFGIARFATVSFSVGYILWLIDRWACDSLTAIKHSIGLPWVFVLELHGWWHIFTAIGAYLFMALVDYLTSEDVGKDPGELLAWPASWASTSFFAGRGRTIPKPKPERANGVKLEHMNGIKLTHSNGVSVKPKPKKQANGMKRE